MDSMVIGEPQILAQVRKAFREAQAEGATGEALAPLFRAAVRAGRRVRAETEIGAAPEAMVAAGLDLAERVVGGLAERHVAVVGAGQMAALAAQVLRARGVASVRIVNRSADRARALAERHGGEAHGLDALDRALAGADVIVACTGAAGIVVGAADLATARERTASGRPLFVLDLAVPRDIDPAAGSLPGVTLVDVDGLAGSLGASSEVRAPLKAGARIVEDEVHRFAARRRAARLAPLIQALRARGDRIKEGELARAFDRMEGLTRAERDTVEAMASAIVAKLLHEPIVHVKELTGPPGAGDQYARALAELFGIAYQPGP
jgi:glutamyl-tRNA reductase